MRRRLSGSEIADLAVAAGNDRNTRAHGRGARLGLVAHEADGLRRRADEDKPGRLDRGGEARILREEAVARMDRAGAAALRRGDDRAHVEIALARGRRADRHRLVGKPHCEALAVGLAIDRDRAEAELARRPDDADGDLAAIGYEELLEHGKRARQPVSINSSACPGSIAPSFSTRKRKTLPSASA